MLKEILLKYKGVFATIHLARLQDDLHRNLRGDILGELPSQQSHSSSRATKQLSLRFH